MELIWLLLSIPIALFLLVVLFCGIADRANGDDFLSILNSTNIKMMWFDLSDDD